jgi:predicted transcriptional regulator
LSYLTPLKSDLKLGIILSLLEGRKKLSELGKDTQTRETTILHVLKELEQLELTTKSDGIYQLTPLGILEAHVCRWCCKSFDVLKNYKEFWLSHDVSAIPPSLMSKIGALDGAVLVKTGEVDLQKVHESFISIVTASKFIMGVSPIFHPDYISVFEGIINKNCRVDLIVTSKVLEKIKTYPNHELLEKFLAEDKLGLYVNDSARCALTVTDQYVSLGLFNLSGTYDSSIDLICSEEEALEWGKQLFKQTLDKSTKL